MKKNFKYIFSLALCTLGLSSCELDLDPISSIGKDTFWTSQENVEAGLYGAYDGLQDLTDIAWTLESAVDDNSTPGDEGSYGDLDTFNSDPSTVFMNDYWKSAYTLITRANEVIYYIDLVTNEELKESILGEALFLRAYTYYKMVLLFGNVPFVTEPIIYDEYEYYSNVPASDIYVQIKADFEQAIELLPTSQNKARASKWAAKGIYAKVLLSLGDKTGAMQQLKDIIDSGEFSLMSNYADIFSSELNQEIIFSVAYNQENGEHQNFSYTFSSKGVFGGVKTTEEYRDIFEDGDLREDASQADDGGPIIINKYASKGSTEQSGVDFIVLRYADVLLLYAEIANQLTALDPTAIDYVNQIRARAGLPAKTFSNQTELNAAIALERRIELAFENHRWFDLLRYGNAIEVMKAHLEAQDINTRIDAHNLLFPIPQVQITLSRGLLTQNPGYSN